MLTFHHNSGHDSSLPRLKFGSACMFDKYFSRAPPLASGCDFGVASEKEKEPDLLIGCRDKAGVLTISDI